jgi:hypothetical protein
MFSVTMYDESTGQAMTQEQACVAVQFVGLFCALGLFHEVEEDGYWGVKDPADNWVLRVEDNGHGDGHWFLPPEPESEPEPAEPEPEYAS